MSYKKYNYQVIAHDNNSPLFRNNCFARAFVRIGELLDIPSFRVGTISRKNDVEYIGDVAVWTKSHKALKAKALKDENYVDNLIDNTLEFADKFTKWTEKNIFKADLKNKTNKQLVTLLEKFEDQQVSLYAYGVAIPTLDFLDFSYVEDNLKKILKARVKAENYSTYYNVFTYPSDVSFSRQQEIELLKLMVKFWDKTAIWQNLESLPERQVINYLRANHKDFYQALKRHTKKYAWVYYVYMGPAYDEEDFLRFIKDYLVRRINPKEELERVEGEIFKYKKLKQEYLERLELSSFEKMILNLAGKIVWGKPRRKDFQSKAYYHSEKLLTEIGRRLYMSLNQVRSTPLSMLSKALLKNSHIDIHYINDIHKMHICLPEDDGSAIVLTGKKAENFSKYKVKRAENNKKTPSIIKGDTACPGKAEGEVKIVNDTPDLIKMNYGDILVSAATNPSLVSAMKKAAAIIADEGGLTCHAAIVSREMNKPAIVNTKFGSSILKDGDKVVVDADKGTIKIKNK